MFCEDCGCSLKPKAKFCSKCGASQITSQTDVDQDQLKSTRDDLVEKVQTLQAEESVHNLEEGKEKVYYRGEGELLVRTTKHHGAGRKVASVVAGGGIGYLVAGRDSKRTTKAKGTIIVTNKAIYCAGNKFEFDNIVAMTTKGTFQKKIHLTLDKTMATGGEGGALSGNRISIEIEIQADDIDGLFKGLENARMSGVEF